MSIIEKYNGGIVPHLFENPSLREEVWMECKTMSVDKDKYGEPNRFVEYSDIEEEIQDRVSIIKGIEQPKKVWDIYHTLYKRGLVHTPVIPTYQQLEQDCTAVSTWGALKILQIKELFYFRQETNFSDIHPTYLYAVSRGQIGGYQLKEDDRGSLPEWVVYAMMNYGILLQNDGNDVPGYSEELTKEWTRNKYKNTKPPYAKFYERASYYGVTAIRLKTVEQIENIIKAGGACTIASKSGMQVVRTNNYGVKRTQYFPYGEWYHQMYIIEVDDNKDGKFVKRMNQWSKTHPIQIDGNETPNGCWYDYKYLQRELNDNYTTVFGYLSFRDKLKI